MTTISITALEMTSIFEQLTQNVGGTMNSDFNEHELTVDNKKGYGTVRGMRLKGGISYLEFAMTFSEDTKLSIASPKQALVNFVYCAEGSVSHAFGDSQKTTTLETFQTGIATNITSETNTLYFKKDVEVVANLITVNTITAGEQQVLNSQLFDTFISGKEEDFTFIGSYNLQVAEQIQRLASIKQKGLVRNLLIEGIVHVMLALEIEQHRKDVLSKHNVTGSLNSKEYMKVKDLSDFVNNFPDTSLTVTEMAQKVGLSPTKLQEGFKLMHGVTVNDYVRDVRVTKSLELLRTTDMNISEILYTLGFSSRSYFSKIFKRKYNCLPSHYRAKNKLAVSA